MSDDLKERLQYLLELMRQCIKILEKYPSDFLPIDLSQNAKSGVNEDKPDQRIKRIISDLPDNMLSCYLDCSNMIGYTMLEVAQKHQHLVDCYKSEKNKMEIIALMKQAELLELNLYEPHQYALFLPYHKCVSALLGPLAPVWLTAKSQDGYLKLQPHETSRVNWIKLGNMKAQVDIETELKTIGHLDSLCTKMIVASAWTMVAMASFMDPSIFYTESTPYVSSFHEGILMISSGEKFHTIVNFWPNTLIQVVRVLREALQNKELEANDMMWIAIGLANIRLVTSREEEKLTTEGLNTGMFLSHRGKDSKRQLMESVLTLDAREHTFLDCFSLPRRMINRNFVFKNLVRSEEVLIVETANFSESVWCRKESALAKILESQKICKLTKVHNIDAALHELERYNKNFTKDYDAESDKGIGDSQRKHKFESGTTNRILTDMYFHGRQPNLYSAKEKGLTTACFQSMLGWLDAATKGSWDDSGLQWWPG